VPVRRVEARRGSARASSAAAAGLLLPDLLTSLDYSALTFLVIASLAAALIGRLRSLWMTLVRRARGRLAQAVLTRTRASRFSIQLPRAAPFVLAIIALLYMSRRRVVTISRTDVLAVRRARTATGASAGLRRPSSAGRSSARLIAAGLLSFASSLPALVRARTGSRRSRASPSTRSPRSASASLRTRRDDLARSGRAALDRLLGRHALAYATSIRFRCSCVVRARS
jgi:hypothetical protein